MEYSTRFSPPRKPLIAGNWKMHGTINDVQLLVTTMLSKLNQAALTTHIDIAVFPTYLHLLPVHALITHSGVLLGAQNLYVGTQGAFTGEVSAAMLVDTGCQLVLVGHSERRTLFKESLDLIAQKFAAAQAAGLVPVLCIGETKEEREAGQTEKVLTEQLLSVIEVVGIEAFTYEKAVIAYEPVWAIGTGISATPQDAQDMHAFVRQFLTDQAQKHEKSKIALELIATIRILYGGSMKADNAPALLAMPDVDGGLIGGASLDAQSFFAICEAAFAETKKCGAM